MEYSLNMSEPSRNDSWNMDIEYQKSVPGYLMYPGAADDAEPTGNGPIAADVPLMQRELG